MSGRALLAPEGQLIIAQRFIAGIRIAERNTLRPVGTMETNHGWFRCPFGTPRTSLALLPSDESLGYFQPSLRDVICDAHALGQDPISVNHYTRKLQKGCVPPLSHSFRASHRW